MAPAINANAAAASSVSDGNVTDMNRGNAVNKKPVAKAIRKH